MSHTFRNQLIVLTLISTAPFVQAGDPTFEIQNKSDHPIWISISNGGKIATPQAKLDALTKTTRSVVEKDIATGQATYLAVWTKNPGVIKIDQTVLKGNTKFTPAPDAIYEFTPGKTIYLTWDKKDFARPQTGPLLGLKGKTESGYSLKNNVKKDDIKAVAYNTKDGIKL